MTVMRVLWKATVFTTICFLVLDVVAFGMWALSGQQPPTDVYAGMFTHAVVGLLLQ